MNVFPFRLRGRYYEAGSDCFSHGAEQAVR